MKARRTLICVALLALACAASHAQGSTPGSDGYWSAKAQCWADLANAEAAQGDTHGTPATALGNAQRIRASLAAGGVPAADAEQAIFSRELLPSSDPRYGRPAWRKDIEAVSAVIDAYRARQCRTALSACLEVAQASVWENMEETQGARWNHGRVEIDKAVALAQQADAEMPTACDTAQSTLPRPATAEMHEIGKQEVLLADVLFPFDSAALSPSGEKAVTVLIERLKKTSTSRSWTVMGHADRFGSSEHNQALSLQRARSISAFIQSHATDVRVVSLSAGSATPVVACPGEFSPATVACLAPNRRVVIRPIE